MNIIVDRPYRLVAFTGGNGGAVVASAIATARIPELDTTFVAAASDDGGATGRLRDIYNVAGSYGDETRVFGALRSAIHPGKALSDILAARLTSGIPGGELFVDFIATWFGQRFGETIKDPRYRAQTINRICQTFNFDNLKEDISRTLFLEALEYRLEADDFPEHTPRNLILFVLERVAQRRGLPLSYALDVMHAIYDIPKNFRVLPVTWESGVLKARTKSGRVINRQFFIDFRDRDPNFQPYDEIETVWLEPPVAMASQVRKAIAEADAFLIGCGSINGNLRAQFCVEGVRDAFWKRVVSFEDTHGFDIPIIHIMNLLNEPGDTLSGKPYTAADIVEVVQRTIGKRPNCVIYDNTEISGEIERCLLPRKKIGLGTLRNHTTASLTPSLIQKKISTLVPGENPDLPWGCIHDPKALAVVFREALSRIMLATGALI